ncbi:hypothetical protein MOLA814_00298 [Betaproteobacteria bacterium MOLA814]|nr:hypothetical protein MOLA814_00298 [Betaproteobacteria bacterium MOLA814]
MSGALRIVLVSGFAVYLVLAPNPFGPSGRSFIPHIAPVLAHPFPLSQGGGASPSQTGAKAGAPHANAGKSAPSAGRPARFSDYSAGNLPPRAPDRAADKR